MQIKLPEHSFKRNTTVKGNENLPIAISSIKC